MADEKKSDYLDAKPQPITIERIPEGTMHLRLGLFSADLKSGEKVSVSNSGAATIIEVDDPKWRKKNPGQLSPFRYIIQGRALIDAVLERYEADLAAGVGKVEKKSKKK